jgi:hypothetical protein
VLRAERTTSFVLSRDRSGSQDEPSHRDEKLLCRFTEGKMLKLKQPETSSGMRWLSRFSGLLWFGQKCPLCTSMLFTEAEHQSLDRLLTLLAFHPVRCANCFRRYYCFSRS